MNDKISPTMADLLSCRRLILKQIQAIKVVADSLSRELRTLEAALDHIDKLIAEVKASKLSKAKSDRKASKRTAA